MAAKCKTCGAKLEFNESRCGYCGTVSATSGTGTQPQELQNQVMQENSYNQFNQSSQPTRNKLGINIAAGVFASINVILLIIYTFHFWGLIMAELDGLFIAEADFAVLGIFVILIYCLMIISLILHIVGLIQSRKHGISIAGHVLGIIGASLTMLTIAVLSFVSVILFLLSAIFTLMQRKVR